MLATDIMDAWRSNTLPQDVETLIAYKRVIDQAERDAFESWRDATCKKQSGILINNHVDYLEASEAIYKLACELHLADTYDAQFDYLR